MPKGCAPTRPACIVVGRRPETVLGDGMYINTGSLFRRRNG